MNLASRPLLKDTILSAQGSSVAKVSHNTCKKKLLSPFTFHLEMVNVTVSVSDIKRVFYDVLCKLAV